MCEQTGGSHHHVIEINGLIEELRNRALFRTREWLHLVELVDEQSIAHVGGNPTGTRVGLGDVALLLERRHLVAHSGRGNAESMALDDRL